jgi:hypothetical protein
MEWIIFLVLGGFLLAGLSSSARAGTTSTPPLTSGSMSPDTDIVTSLDDTDSLASDIYTDPAYSHLPGNIYYHLRDDGLNSDMTDDLCTNPAYDFLACNIHHRHDEWHDEWHTDDWSSSTGSGIHWDD